MHGDLLRVIQPLANAFKQHGREDTESRLEAWGAYQRAHPADARFLEKSGLKKQWMREANESCLTATAMADELIAYRFDRTREVIRRARAGQ